MTRLELPLLMACLLAGASAGAPTDPAFREPRGEMLYTTHCTGCHNTQVHWRDGKLATNWESLRAQVKRWQNFSGLAWTDDDINEVTRHLNTIYYKFPPAERATRKTDPTTKVRFYGYLPEPASPRFD